MRSDNNKFKINNFIKYVLVIICLFPLLILLIACGRRGDPVSIIPYDEKNVETERYERGTESVDRGAEETTVKAAPDAPVGLKAAYTGRSVILLWDETIGDGIIIYKVYRSEGGEYKFIGSTATPVFSDYNVLPGVEYFYKVSAAGKFDGPFSEELQIMTDGDVR